MSPDPSGSTQQHVQNTRHVDLDVAAVSDEVNMSIHEAFLRYPKAVLFTIGMTLVIVMEGYDTALIGSFFGLLQFRRAYGEVLGNGDYQIDANWQSACGSISSVGGIIGLAIAGWVTDRVGYRYTMFLGLFLVTGAIFIVFFAHSIQMIFVGGFVCGIPWGMFQAIASAYATDLSPLVLRPILTSYINLCWAAGQFLSTGVLRAMLGREDEWAYRIPFAVQWAWVPPITLIVLFAPESPWWLVRAGKQDQAMRVLRQLASSRVSDDEVHETLRQMVLTNELERRDVEGTSYADLFRRSNLRRTEISAMAWVSQVFSGIWFSTNIIYFMQQAGLSESVSFSFGLAVNATGFLGTIVSWFISPRFGRRTMYLWGLTAMLITELIVGFMYIKPTDSIGWAAGAILIVNVLAYFMTVGPVCYTIVPEAPTSRLRIKTVSFARACYNAVAIMAGFLNPQILNPQAWDLQGKGGFIWGSFCLVSLVWTFFRLPEMKGRTHAELDILFCNKTRTRDFATAIVDSNQLHVDMIEKTSNGMHIEDSTSKRAEA